MAKSLVMVFPKGVDFNKLYDLKDNVYSSKNSELIQDFKYLQVSDHFYYMSTKFFSDGEVHYKAQGL